LGLNAQTSQTTAQLAVLARVHQLLTEDAIDYWLFGGWAVDFHAQAVTRQHADIDIAIWSKDRERVAALLVADGWEHAPEQEEDGYTGYQRETVRLEIAFLVRLEDGEVCTPLRDGYSAWPAEAFKDDVAELSGFRARVMSLDALKEDKSEHRNDPAVAAKDRIDMMTLSRVS
jgi:hypothetical protein